MEVTLKQVGKTFKTRHGEVQAVKDFSVTIQSGKLVGFLGPSGCGKSTTLYMLAGVYQITGGQILFDGQDVSALQPEQRNVGMVFQNYALYPHLSVRDNIAFPLVNAPKTRKAIVQKLKQQGRGVTLKDYVEKRVQETARLVEITQYLDRRPAELSGGQQQRVAIARALVKRPSLLLLDEPLSNLDARLRLQTREEIKRIQQETGVTTVFVTHDQEEALNICDEIVIMKDGVFQQQGTPKEVYEQPDNEFVARFLGAPPINLLKAEVKEGSLWLCGHPWKAIPKKNAKKLAAVTVGIRAENLFLAENPLQKEKKPKETISAAVESVSKLGGASIMTAKLPDGQEIKLFYDYRIKVKPGDEVAVTVLEGAVCLFDQEGRKVAQW